jgi:tetratricopeptide (TPR) repeat protein
MVDRGKKELGDRINAEWSVHSVLCRSMAEVYLERYPTDGFIWAIYGDTLRRLGCFAEAATALQTARGLVETDANRAFVSRFMGDLHWEMHDPAAAEGRYREAAAIEPHRGFWLLLVGVALRNQGREAEAEECYRKALTLEGDRDIALFNLGLVLQARGDLEEAARCFEEALRIDPVSEKARGSLEDVRRAIAFRQEQARRPGQSGRG